MYIVPVYGVRRRIQMDGYIGDGREKKTHQRFVIRFSYYLLLRVHAVLQFNETTYLRIIMFVHGFILFSGFRARAIRSREYSTHILSYDV